MRKAEIRIELDYYRNYVEWVEDLPLVEALQKYAEEIQNIDSETLNALGTKVYAPGKWTVKEILQHLIDWERIFSYRALVYARKDANRPVSHDENVLAPNSKANQKSWEDLKNDFLFVRSSTISLFQSFDEEDLMQPAFSGDSEFSVLGFGFSMVGHQIHHFNIIQERYLPLLGREVELVKGMRC